MMVLHPCFRCFPLVNSIASNALGNLLEISFSCKEGFGIKDVFFLIVVAWFSSAMPYHAEILITYIGKRFSSLDWRWEDSRTLSYEACEIILYILYWNNWCVCLLCTLVFFYMQICYAYIILYPSTFQFEYHWYFLTWSWCIIPQEKSKWYCENWPWSSQPLIYLQCVIKPESL